MKKKEYVDSYTQGWYDHGRMMGVFLWDLELSDIDESVVEEVREIAALQYKRKCQPKPTE